MNTRQRIVLSCPHCETHQAIVIAATPDTLFDFDYAFIVCSHCAGVSRIIRTAADVPLTLYPLSTIEFQSLSKAVQGSLNAAVREVIAHVKSDIKRSLMDKMNLPEWFLKSDPTL